MPINVGALEASLSLDQTKFIKGVKDSQKNIENFSKRMQRVGQDMQAVGRSMTLRLTLPLTAVGVAALKMASDAEETQSKFNVVFGSMAKEANRWSENFGASVGRSRTDVKRWMATLQDTFVPMGIARKDAAKFSKELVTLAVDVASFNNAADDQVIMDFQSALVGNHETLRKYGVVINETTLKEEAYSSGIAETGKALTEQQKIQARLNLIYEGTTDAQGDAIRTAESFANQMKRVQAEVKDAGEDLGKILIPYALEFLKALRGMIDRFNDLSPAGKKVAVVIGAIAAGVSPLIFLVGTMITKLGAMKQAWVGMGQAAQTSWAKTIGPAALAATAVAGVANAEFKRTNILKKADKVGKEVRETEGRLAGAYEASKVVLQDSISAVIFGLIPAYESAGMAAAKRKKAEEKAAKETKKAVVEAAQTAAEETKKAQDAQTQAVRSAAIEKAKVYISDQTAVNALTDQINNSTEEQIMAFDASVQKFHEWVGIFDEVPKKVEVTGAELAKRLQEQVNRFSEWANNIKALSSRIPKEMAAELKKAGPANAAEIDALTKMTEQELNKYVGLWREKQRLATEAARSELNKAAEPVRQEARKVGQASIEGMTAGAQDPTQRAYLDGAIAATTGKFNKTAEVSNWGSAVGRAYVAGMVGGLISEAERKLPGSTGALGVIAPYMKGESPPKKGPLKDIDKWGFNIGKAWSEGMASGLKGLNRMKDTLSQGLAQRISMPVMMPAMASGNSSSDNRMTFNVTIQATPGTDGRKVGRDFIDTIQSKVRSANLRRGL